MATRMRMPGALVAWRFRRGTFGVLRNALTLSLLFAYIPILVWVPRFADNWTRIPGGWMAFIVGTIVVVPPVASLLVYLPTIELDTRREYRIQGVWATGTGFVSDVAVTPSRPYGYGDAVRVNVWRCVLQVVVVIVSWFVVDSQLGKGGSGHFVVWWIAVVACSWGAYSLVAGPITDLVSTFVRSSRPPEQRGALFRTVYWIALLFSVAVVTFTWENFNAFGTFGSFVRVFGWPVAAGAFWAAVATTTAALSSRVIARDLRHVGTVADTIPADAVAEEVVIAHDTPGFLVVAEDGSLVGWASRADLLAQPTARVGDLARVLIDSTPVAAVAHVTEFGRSVDPARSENDVVALADEGTPVGYVRVVDAYEHLTGHSGWRKAI